MTEFRNEYCQRCGFDITRSKRCRHCDPVTLVPLHPEAIAIIDDLRQEDPMQYLYGSDRLSSSGRRSLSSIEVWYRCLDEVTKRLHREE